MIRPLVSSLSAAFFFVPFVHAQDEPIERIAFVSCHKESRDAPALEAIAKWKPDVFIWMGDTIYGDSEDPAVLEEKYEVVKEKPWYQEIVATASILATWDDHDYGKNDAGKEYAAKETSQSAFLDFLEVPKENPRREQKGVYSSKDYGPEGQQVRIILLDTRYYRDPIGSNGALLGEEQWSWLERTLIDSPAAINLLVSSIQVLAVDHRFEKWSNFPHEKARLFELLSRKGAPPVVILSGDRHLAEISLDEKSLPYPLYDLTSSSLNFSFGGSPEEVNRYRIGANYGRNNFGSLDIDWSGPSPVIRALIQDEDGKPQLEQVVEIPTE